MAGDLDSIDRALQTHKTRSRIVSAAILVVGLLIVAALLFSPARRRERAASHLRVGDDSTAVLDALGERPTRCMGAGVDHLADEFPAGTPRPAREAALSRLRRATAARWIYPGQGGCRPAQNEAEVGLDERGRVLWVLPAAGRVPLVLSEA